MANEMCPHCSTEHDDHVETVLPWCLHNLARCRDIIRGQRDEAIRALEEIAAEYTRPASASNVMARAALEKLRGK